MKKKLSIIFIALSLLSACKKSEDPEPDKGTPVAVDDSYSIDANSTDNIFYVLENDSDPNGDALNFTDMDMERGGSMTNIFDPVTGKRYLSYSPAENVMGLVNIYYTISDGKGNTARGHVTVHIGNDAQKATWALIGSYINQYAYLDNSSSKSLNLENDNKAYVSGSGSPISDNDSWLLLSSGKLSFTHGTTEKIFTVSSFTASPETPAFKLVPDDNTSLSYLYYKRVF